MGYLNTCSFNFDGVGSEQYGLYIGWEGAESDIPTGLDKEILKGDVNMVRHKANQYGTVYSSVIEIEFMILHKDDSHFSQAESRSINKWLMQETYKPLRFNNENDTENITYYVICTSIVDKVYNGHNAKLVTFEADSPFGYTSKTAYRINALNGGTGSKKIVNTSDDGIYYPILQIKCNEDYSSPIVISNTTENKSMSINTDQIPVINNQKIININTSLMQISDGNNKIIPAYKLGWEIPLNENSPIQSMDKYWPRLIEGQNEISVTGNCEVIINCQFPRKVGVV